MAALLVLAVASPHGSAAAVVLANRTPEEVRFIVAHEAQEQAYSLAPDEVRTAQVLPASDLWFADDPENGYRLRDDCAYVFLRNRDRRLELHRLGLADEQAWLEDVPRTARDSSALGSANGRQTTGAAALDREDQTITGQPRRHDPAETAEEGKATPGKQEGVEDERANLVSDGEEEPDPLALPKVLALALVLTAIPGALLAWRLRHLKGAERQSAAQETASPTWEAMRSADHAVWSVYLVSVVGVGMLSAASMFPGGTGGLKAAALLLSAAVAAMTVAPYYPIIGPLAYLVLSYAVQGDDPATVRIDNSGVLVYLPLLALGAVGVRWWRQRRRPRPTRGGTVWLFLAMTAWVGVAAVGAVASGRPVSSNLVHRTAPFAQVLALFLVTLYADVGLAELRLTSLALALVLFVRVHVFRADVRLDQDLAMLAAVVSPLLFVAARTAPSRLAKGGFYLMLGYFVSLIVYMQNRAAMLALPAAAAVLLLFSRQRRRALLIAAPFTAALAAWLPGSGLVDRFAEIYQEGEFQGSAYYRLRIWTAGWHMARDHAALGVGPGNFELLIGDYDSQLTSIPSHNSFVQMAAETGLMGLAIYVGLIVTAGLQLASIGLRNRDDWRGCVAGGVLACLAAHIVTGCFLENPSLAATYILLGIGITLGAAPVTRVYRERLYLPLPDLLARPLAELVVRLPRVVSGMPVAQWSGHSHGPTAEEIAARPVKDRPPDLTWWVRLLLVFDVLATMVGSLAPFSFRPMGVQEAVDLYWRRMSGGIEFGDLSDWLANVLLFAPLGFLTLAACCPPRPGARRITTSLLVVAGCMLSSGAIELAQVWFPSRTVNLNDVVAETLGAAAGVLGFLLFGDRLLKLAAGFFARRNRLSASEMLLVCYAAAVIVYAAWPFDFTISPTDFASKLRAGRLDFMDWTRPGWFAYFMASAALMAPLGVLLTTLGLQRGASVRSWPALMAWGGGWLLGIELCRLLAFSQSVGLVHLAGGATGILLGGLARKCTGSR